MGMLDSLGSLGGLTKMLDVGNIVKDVVDKVLPQNMHFVGDIAGAVVDFKSGNLIGAAQLGMQALKDLPQATKGQQPQGAAPNPGGTDQNKLRFGLEPTPPPLTSRDGKPFDWNELLSAVKALTTALTGQGANASADASKSNGAATGGATTAPAAPASSATAGAAPAAPNAHAAPTASAAPPANLSPQASTPAGASSPSTTESRAEHRNTRNSWRGGVETATPEATGGANWRGQPTTSAATTATQPAPATSASPAGGPAAPASSTAAASTAQAATSSAAAAPAAATPTPAADHPAGASTATPAAKSASTSAPAAAGAAQMGQTVASVAQLNGMTDAAFLDAVRNGRISPDVAKDPTAMMAVQQRMNDITQMNNLMTGMMRAIHDMQMAVIQNIRI